MKQPIMLVGLAALVCFGLHPLAALAEGDLTKQQPIDVKVQLGNEKNASSFLRKSSSLRPESCTG